MGSMCSTGPVSTQTRSSDLTNSKSIPNTTQSNSEVKSTNIDLNVTVVRNLNVYVSQGTDQQKATDRLQTSAKPATFPVLKSQEEQTKDSLTMSERKRPLRTVSFLYKQENKTLRKAHPELKSVLKDIEELAKEKRLLSAMESYEESQIKDVNKYLIQKLLKPFDEFPQPDQRKLIGNHIVQSNLFPELIDCYIYLAEDEKDLEGDFTDAFIMKNIRWILWNYSDQSEDMRLAITDRQDMLGLLGLDLERLVDEEVNKEHFVFTSAVGILNNCSRGSAQKSKYHELSFPSENDGSQAKTLNLVHCLLPYLENKDDYVRLITLLVLSRIVDEDDNHLLEAKSFLFDFLLDTIRKAMKDENRRCDGFSVDELVDGLSHMAKNDKNKTTIMGKGAFTVLKEVLLEGNDLEQLAAVHAIWELSYDNENANIFQNDEEVSRHLLELRSSDVKDLAEGAKWTCFQIGLEGKDKIRAGGSGQAAGSKVCSSPATNVEQSSDGSVIQTEKEEEERAGHIMISYNWGHQELLLKIYGRLKAEGFNMWMDVYNLSGDLLSGMSNAVENADVVLICFSEKYKNSKNCRTEGNYAYDCADRLEIIALKMEKYKADGWLGGLIAGKLYYDFSREDGYEEALQKLIINLKRVLKDQKKKLPTPLPQANIEPAAVTSLKGILTWENSDIVKWAEQNNLNTYLGRKLYTVTGNQLVFLCEIYKRAPEFFYRCLKEELGLEGLEQLSKFNNAIKNLFKEYPELNKMF